MSRDKQYGFRKGKKEELRQKVIDKIFDAYSDKQIELISDLTQDDFRYIEEQKRYFDLKDISPYRAKVILQSDMSRRARDKALVELKEKIIAIRNIKATLKRARLELVSGNIEVNEIKPGVPMTKDELEVHIDLLERQAYSNSLDVINPLHTLAAYVGTKDIAKNVVLTDEEFNNIVKDTETKLEEMGYKLFEV